MTGHLISIWCVQAGGRGCCRVHWVAVEQNNQVSCFGKGNEHDMLQASGDCSAIRCLG
jgi:hypothetical protein